MIIPTSSATTTAPMSPARPPEGARTEARQGEGMQMSAPLHTRHAAVRAQTLALAEPLGEADCQAQSMPDASPVKWHLAHTTWFFETFLLERFEPDFRPEHPAFRVLFNSYYHGVGAQHPRAQRGLITRPTLAEVLAYRARVDERVQALLARPLPAEALAVVELGLQHEQQHQELILTDVLHLLSCNPLAPAYRRAASAEATHCADAAPGAPRAPGWQAFDGGLVDIGHAGAGFAFDNETPRHAVHLRPYALAERLVTQGEWAEFIADGGYREPRWWLSAGWDWVRSQGIEAPLYWRAAGDAVPAWQVFDLGGLGPLRPPAPVLHLSCYEADAYARWRGAQDSGGGGAPLRLPTEAEWEHAAATTGAAAWTGAQLLESGELQARPAQDQGHGQPPSARAGLQQLFGTAWEWTASAYSAYPGFRAWEGAVGEYNAKFMLDQQVLRGGSLATPRSHLRASYRNFFPAATRWQFSGLRLAQDR